MGRLGSKNTNCALIQIDALWERQMVEGKERWMSRMDRTKGAIIFCCTYVLLVLRSHCSIICFVNHLVNIRLNIYIVGSWGVVQLVLYLSIWIDSKSIILTVEQGRPHPLAVRNIQQSDGWMYWQIYQLKG